MGEGKSEISAFPRICVPNLTTNGFRACDSEHAVQYRQTASGVATYR
jgi:hypothetical protein